MMYRLGENEETRATAAATAAAFNAQHQSERRSGDRRRQPPSFVNLMKKSAPQHFRRPGWAHPMQLPSSLHRKNHTSGGSSH